MIVDEIGASMIGDIERPKFVKKFLTKKKLQKLLPAVLWMYEVF
jgi:hypothetical protein